MKAKALIFYIALSFPLISYSSDWVKVNIDSLATVEMPAYPNIEIPNPNHGYELKTDSISLIVMDQVSHSIMPKNLKGLDDTYNGFLEGVISTLQKKSKRKIVVMDKKTIVYGGLRCLCTEIYWGDSVAYSTFYRIFLIKNHFITTRIIYNSRESEKYQSIKSRFLNSLNFVDNVSVLDQLSIKGQDNRKGFTTDSFFQMLGSILAYILIAFVIIKLIRKYWAYMKYKY
jgi:hypothetical protein